MTRWLTVALVFAALLRTLEARADEATAAVPPPPPPAPPLGVVVDAGARGFGFTSPDGKDSLYIHWLVQTDYYTFLDRRIPPGAPTRDTFTIGFAGLQLDANLSGIWHSSILVDFSESRLTLLDAFLEARVDPALVLRIGKFETPLTEERLTPKFLCHGSARTPPRFCCLSARSARRFSAISAAVSSNTTLRS